MSEFQNHNDETPPNWERYGEMLRRQPRPAMAEDRMRAMMPRFDEAIAERARRIRVMRWVATPALSAAAIIAVIMFQLAPQPSPEPALKRAAPAIVQNTNTRPRPAHRVIRKRLPPPSISYEFDDEPELVSNAPAVRGELDMPREEQIVAGPGPGPGVSHRTPR